MKKSVLRDWVSDTFLSVSGSLQFKGDIYWHVNNPLFLLHLSLKGLCAMKPTVAGGVSRRSTKTQFLVEIPPCYIKYIRQSW